MGELERRKEIHDEVKAAFIDRLKQSYADKEVDGDLKSLFQRKELHTVVETFGLPKLQEIRDHLRQWMESGKILSAELDYAEGCLEKIEQTILIRKVESGRLEEELAGMDMDTLEDVEKKLRDLFVKGIVDEVGEGHIVQCIKKISRLKAPFLAGTKKKEV